MSQRKAKEYRQAMEQYHGVVEDVDDLKRRIGAMEARHNREDQLAAYQRRKARREWEEFQAQQEEREEREKRRRQEERRRQLARQRIAMLTLAVLAVIVMLAMAIKATSDAEVVEYTPTATPVVDIEPEVVAVLSNLWDGEGEDPMEAEKIEAALLAQGYLSDAVPLSYNLQDIMRTACEEYGCPYSLALAVAEVESNFDMEAVGAVGEVGVMQLNPGPENTYWINLQAETNQDPTTPAGNIVCGVYLLGTHLINYEDTEKALMAYNMGPAGALQAWEDGITSTEYTEKVMEAMDRWEAVLG